MEAWVNPTSVPTGIVALVFFNGSGNQPAYLLGLDSGYPFAQNANSGSDLMLSGSAVPLAANAWTHVAANYQTAYGIALGGKSYLDAGSKATLDLDEAMTVEAWVKVDSIAGTQAVVSKWGTKDSDRSWRLYLDGGLPTFEVMPDPGSGSLKVQGSQTLTTGIWHRLAGTYDVQSKRETAVHLPSTTSAITFGTSGQPMNQPPSNAISIAFWFRHDASVFDPVGSPFMSFFSSSVVNMPWTYAAFSLMFMPMALVGRTQLRFNLGPTNSSGSFAATYNMPAIGGWNHLAVTCDLGSKKVFLYVNGSAVAWTAQGQIPASIVYASATQPYKVMGVGWINELSLWNRALAVDEVIDCMTISLVGDEPGLVGYWPMNDRIGTTVADRTFLNNGTLNGASFEQVDKSAFSQELRVDGQSAGWKTVVAPIRLSRTSVRLGADSSADYLQGTIGPARVWNVPRADWEIDQTARTGVAPDSSGLVSALGLPGRRGGRRPRREE